MKPSAATHTDQRPYIVDIYKRFSPGLRSAWRVVASFARRHRIGLVLFGVATLIFFWPLASRITTYSEGGDAMFNAWTVARDQHCILRQGCPNYLNGNIFFPHKDTMLYSETQLSAGLLTLPLLAINQNPIFSYNVWTICSFFFMGFFMYLLAKHLSKRNELIAVAAGLVFEFAPFQMAAIGHLQNLSIFYVPLALLLVLKYRERAKRSYLVGLFVTLTLLFYASWYQMIFGLTAVAVTALVLYLTKQLTRRQLLGLSVSIVAAALAVLPLGLQYIRFSKQNSATFGLKDQLLYSSHVQDYIIPHTGTFVGKLYYHLYPGKQHNAYNLDSFSYHSVTLYIVAALTVFAAFKLRKKDAVLRQRFYIIVALAVIGLVGFLASLGPLLQLKGGYIYGTVAGNSIAIPAPYLLVDKLLPQLHFIRAVGRWSVLLLIALCCLLALSPSYLALLQKNARKRKFITWAVLGLLVIELAPMHMYAINHEAYANQFSIPAVYKYVKSHKQIDDIVIIAGDSDYPGAKIPIAQAEWTLWAGYDNRNTFNGYSGYQPPEFLDQYINFKDLDANDVVTMKKLGIRYVIIDKQLSKTRPALITNAQNLFAGHLLYHDKRYDLYKV